jgi:DNA replication protein DnaC
MAYDNQAQAQVAVCETHGEFKAVMVDNPMLKRRLLSPCPGCAEQKRADAERRDREMAEMGRQIAMREKLRVAGVPNRFDGKSFGDYIADTPEKQAVLEKCRGYADNFRENYRAGRNLILIGTPGTGKTHLASAVANQVNRETPCTAAYRTIGGILQSIKNTYGGNGKESEGDIVSRLVSVDLLVLDEIGATREKPSDFELSVIFSIINGRYENEMPTVIVSNLAADGLTQAIGDRCADRLREGSPVVVQLKWPSARRGIA